MEEVGEGLGGGGGGGGGGGIRSGRRYLDMVKAKLHEIT